jgi:hypothetical protein
MLKSCEQFDYESKQASECNKINPEALQQKITNSIIK